MMDGKFKTRAGYPATITHVDESTKTLNGIVYFGDYEYKTAWDENGTPNNLPINKELNLVPLRKVVSYEPIPKQDQFLSMSTTGA